MGEALRKRIQQDKFDSPAIEAMFNLLIAADSLRQRTQSVCEEFGVTGAQYNVLRILRGVHPGGHSRCEIAKRMLERSPDVTRLVDRLEERGLAERDRSDEDRRLSITIITKAGLDLLKTMDPGMSELHRYFTERVSRADCRELSRICEGLYGEEA